MKCRHKTVCYTVGRPDITQQTCYTTKTASAEVTPDGRRYRPNREAGMSNIITQIETQNTVDLHCSVHTHVGKPNTTTKNHIWRQRQQQIEAYNFGVEFGLEAHTTGEKIPTAFDGYNHLTKLRHSNKISSSNVFLQRAGIQLGLETVTRWAKARRKHEWNVTNTEKRLDKTISKWKTKKPTAKQIEALQKAFLAHSRAIDKLRRHQDKGTDRLYRRRKTLRYVDGPSLIYNGGCRLADGCLYMPGGVNNPTRRQSFLYPRH